MFDKLVESAKQKQGGRARRLFLATGVIYVVALTALGVATIVGFSPALAEEYNIITCVIPPPAPSAPDPKPAQAQLNHRPEPNPGFLSPREVKPLDELAKLNLEFRKPELVIVGAPIGAGTGSPGAPGAPITGEPAPPPPAPVVNPSATPAQDQVVRLTSVLTQGRALRKAQPPYPAIARQSRVSGPVQVQITISEDGEVTEATLLSGHPLLRDAALQAARQWLFKPTELNGRPVRAIGVITFNFTLN